MKYARGQKITRASCRKRANAFMPRAEIFGDLITADHKILSEESESRNHHRYALVQELATQCLQSYPFKTKSFQETQKNLMKFLETTRKPKVIYSDNSLEFGKSCEELSWNHCTSTAHTHQKQIGLLEEQLAQSRKGLLRCFRSPVWIANGGRIPWNVTAIYEIFKINFLMGKHLTKGGSEWPLTDQLSRLEQCSNITLFLLKTYRDCISSAQNLARYLSSRRNA